MNKSWADPTGASVGVVVLERALGFHVWVPLVRCSSSQVVAVGVEA